jgi:hypothetical protein
MGIEPMYRALHAAPGADQRHVAVHLGCATSFMLDTVALVGDRFGQ